MKVFITGAAGYIGKHVVKEFLDKGHTVIACDLSFKGVDERAEKKDINIFSGDEELYCKIGKPDLVVHLAWKDGFVHNSAAHMKFLSDHFIFLKNLATAGCHNIAVMGSMHEVGYWEGAINEDTPCNPLSQYGIAKNALRESLKLLSKELKFNLYWLRAYYIYGDDTLGSSIFSKLLQAENDGKKEFPFTSGKNKYDFISVYDLAKQIAAASTQDKITGIINVCSGNPVSLGNQVEWFIKNRGLAIKLIYGVFPERQYDSPAIWGDAEKIKTIMGLKQYGE